MLLYFLIIGRLFIYFYIRKKQFISITFVSFFANLLITNFDNLRYQTKYDNRGNEYTHDLLTGKKWKKRSQI